MIKADTSSRIIPSRRKGLIDVGVYSPWRVDTQGEAILPEELEATAHDFNASGRFDRIDQEHNNILTGCRVAESFISQEGDVRFPVSGTWGVTIQLTLEAEADVESGKINGLSLQWKKPPIKRTYPTFVATPVFGEGISELSLGTTIEPHSHPVQLRFDENGRIVPVITGPPIESNVFFHVHEIVLSTSTETTMGHAHRLDLEPNDPDHSIQIAYDQKIMLVTYLFDLRVDWISLVEHGANWMPLNALKIDRSN